MNMFAQMKFMHRKCLLLLVIFNFYMLNLSAKNEKDSIKISLITCSPGEDLYSIFGHTAIRVIDFATQTDVIFNYGTFDFYDPNFYVKFVKGKLDYFVSTDNPNDFFIAYNQEKRNITEQELNVPDSIKTLIQQYLSNNALPQNRNYKYDFLYSNCTTKIRDILKNYIDLNFDKQILDSIYTFRNAIHFYLNKTKSPWNKLGIDLLLGSTIDTVMTVESSNFLPENLMHTMALHKSKLFKTNNYPSSEELKFKSAFINPLLFFSIIALLIAFCSFKFSQKRWAKILVSFYVFVTGLVGVLLVFMWLGTNHQACANNYNLLWSLPTNIVGAFLMFKQNKLRKNYFLMAFIIQNLTLASWFFMPQEMNLAFLPIVILNVLIYFKQLK